MIIEGGGEAELKNEAVRRAAAWICRSGRSPCGACADCRKAFSGNHVDISIVGGDGNIKVDTIRTVKKDAYIRPFDAERKAYIILRAELMNISAQNALLVLLEEPPEYASFILTCHDSRSLLPTVRSRCVSVRMAPGQTEDFDPEVKARAEAFCLAIRDEWELAKTVLMWDNLSRDDMKATLNACLSSLRGGWNLSDNRRVGYTLAVMDKIIALLDALEQNASVGTVCGALALYRIPV